MYWNTGKWRAISCEGVGENHGLEPGESFASCEIQVPSQDVIMSMLFFLP